MATVLTKEKASRGEGDSDNKLDPDASTRSVTSIPPLGAPIEERRFWFQRAKSYDPDAIATQASVFDDPETAEKYHPRVDWENIGRFDPLARWTWAEEHRLVRKIDLRIMVWACIMFMALELDRANISQALTDNFLTDLHLTTDDYNFGNTVFKLSFLCAELPSQLVSKWMGPDRWIPSQMVLWSLVASSQFWLSGRDSFLACRALLGLLQGGFIPDVILYLSYFYKHHEMSLRLGFFWTAMSTADIISALLGAGLLHLRGVQGKSGWRWLFLIEGLLTLVIGIFAFLLMPAGPCQTASWFRGKKGWFDEREEKIIVNRVLREDPSKSGMHNREPITPRLLWQSLKDYDLWPLYILGLVFQIPATPPQQYLTLSLRGLGFDTFQSNLLSIPWNVLHMISMLGITYLAEIINELTLVSLSGQIWILPFLIYLSVANTGQANRWVLFAVTSLLLSYPNAHPIQVGWNSRNSNTVRSRTVSAACYNMFVQASGIISSNIYRSAADHSADDAPLYRRGNRQLLAITCMNIALYLLVKVYYIQRNKSRDRKWNAMSTDERLEYLATTEDKGNKRLDFRFQH
ncbi:major facilitator superfamily domain-containing protein [Lasiosphaeria miniovina]|uniref:Major facilitator superfamily domain-containing protein n=1 Tax=Lasiosphaeria miniovina TaxID=1954250 RepID=A0AA40DYR0_9PEZI|nr:major facilitator superfamily domain-containing protein [Lasiosphaeria miniovina]KAK0717876.1 major facilitator superfamily domain-containing protein [Lasiosphaeria miniovina]